MADEILKFIANFDGAQSTFMNGCCYWFAHILRERFSGGDILYEMIDGHFLWKYEGHYYDVRGDVTDRYLNTKCHFVYWDEYEKIDSKHYQRIVRDCVLKEDYNE